jgi:hypothetical protein
MNFKLRDPDGKAYHTIYLFFLNLSIIMFALLIMHKIHILRIDVILRFDWLCAIFLVCLVISFISKHEYLIIRNKKNELIESTFNISPYFFTALFVIISLNQFLKIEFITSRLFYLSILAIAFCFMTFYRYREASEKNSSGEEEEDNKSIRIEKFPHKFPSVNKIPFLGRIIKWMYSEGWSYSITLLIIILAFLMLKIGLPIAYTGSYIDEYIHIWSGIEFFNSGHFAELYTGSYYTGGAYVSILVGLFFKIFGQSLFSARMVPALIGIFDFFLLYSISKHTIKKKKYRLFLMAIYLISPWVIFNHFYIRFYIFYEFFLLTLTYCFIKLLESKKGDSRKVAFYLTAFFLINIVGLLLNSNDSKYLFALISGLLILGLFLFKIKLQNGIKISVLLFCIIIIGLVFNIQEKIFFLINAQTIFSTPGDFKYNYYFLELNLLFTSLFFSALAFVRKSRLKELLLITSFVIVFIVHMISSPDLQVMRGIMYFFPIFYLISISALSRIEIKKSLKILIGVLLILVLFTNYPTGFFSGPNIPNEIIYKDYKDSSEYAVSLLDGQEVIFTTNPQIIHFYGSGGNKVYLVRDNEDSYYDERLKYEEGGKTYYTLTNTEVITSPEDFKKAYLEYQGGVVYIDTHLRWWITSETQNLVQENFIRVDNGKYENIEVWVR